MGPIIKPSKKELSSLDQRLQNKLNDNYFWDKSLDKTDLASIMIRLQQKVEFQIS